VSQEFTPETHPELSKLVATAFDECESGEFETIAFDKQAAEKITDMVLNPAEPTEEMMALLRNVTSIGDL